MLYIMTRHNSLIRKALSIAVQWLDSHAGNEIAQYDRIDRYRAIPFILLHLLCLGVIWVGFSWVAFTVAVMLYLLRMFFITGFYHRYFSHRSFRTTRAFQLVMAVCGCATVQRGPLWWAGHHRFHHAHADQPEDSHSPRQRGFLWSHLGWFLSQKNVQTPLKRVKDWAKYPELMFIDRFDWIIPVLLIALLYALGASLAHFMPHLGTSGMQMVIWGFFISTVVLFHATYTINSLAHLYGSRRFETSDDSRNNFLLALITLGEGWHNNHHHYPASIRQGFFWWEFDPTYYLLWVLSKLGLIWDLKPVPVSVIQNPHARKTKSP